MPRQARPARFDLPRHNPSNARTTPVNLQVMRRSGAGLSMQRRSEASCPPCNANAGQLPRMSDMPSHQDASMLKLVMVDVCGCRQDGATCKGADMWGDSLKGRF